MWRFFSVLISCMLTLLLTACASLEPAQISELPNATPTLTPSPTPLRTPSSAILMPVPEKTYAPDPEGLPMFTEHITPSEDTVIVADSDGLIIGGYSNGEWLSHSQAAAYCGQTMTFYQRSLGGYEHTVKSTGITMDFWGDSGASGTVTMSNNFLDYNDPAYLDTVLPKYDPARDEIVLYYCPPESLPEIEQAFDISPFVQIVQEMLDKEFGKGEVSAQINGAYTVDIDGNGTKETIINAGNNERDNYNGDFSDGYWYSIALLVESTGAVYEIEKRSGFDYYDNVDFACVRGVVDINGDGTYEVIKERRGYEWWLMDVYQYDGHELTWVFGLSYGS